MANFQSLLLVFFSSLLFLQARLMMRAGADEERKAYIVYMGSLPRVPQYSPSSHHASLLQNVIGISFSPNLVIGSYTRSFNGFAAKLTNIEAEKLSSREDVVTVFPDRKYKPLTTRSWDFMGLSEKTSRNPQIESDIVIGVIDTGIWPESASFDDEGYGPPPKKWNGSCQGGSNFICNNKLIGARYYGSSDSARDVDGHGTHTASTAAGNAVKQASFYGLAEGTARGGVPSARIAAYKVCDDDGCPSANILAAFDDAIADGVDVISISLGSLAILPLDKDPIAIGAFHAFEKWILTSQPAGNGGPSFGSISSVAPWLLSIAASSTDRRIIDKVVLGNGSTLVGRSINSFNLNETKFPSIYRPDASDGCSEVFARQCRCLTGSLVKGQIVLCDKYDALNGIVSTGALGVIYQSDADYSDLVPLPALALNSVDFEVVRSYCNLTEGGSRDPPVGSILKSETIKDPNAPMVASFSSRGPNSILSEIMKPDVSAPGIEILAAYSPALPASNIQGEKRHVKYNILSGTSMACPHISGVAAYVKSFHPDWSPSAIKSAIMTTATPMNATANPEAEFGYGSGHVNPTNATQPGLIYEMLKEDYIKLLCRAGFHKKKIRLITGDNSSCPHGGEKGPILDFNYPALTAVVAAGAKFEVVFERTVTNVGKANSTYRVNVSSTSKFDVKVKPEILSFESLKEKKSFNVTVSGESIADGVPSTSLVWSDGIHNVRTPIIVHTIQVGQDGRH